MKKLFSKSTTGSLFIVFILTFSFFVPNLIKGKIPIPGDNLLGLYHPFRDVSFDGYASQKFPSKNPLITDPVLQTYPWRFLAIKNLKSFKIPYWNPYNFAGQPLLANVQSAPFSVFNLLFIVLPFNYAWALQTILTTVATAVFMYLFLKAQKIANRNLSNVSAIFGSVVLAFSGFYVAWLEWNTIVISALWLPLILLCTLKIFEKNKPIWFLILCFGLSQVLLSGHLQTALYVYLATSLYAIFLYLKTRKLFNLLALFGAFFLAVLIAAPQLIPAIEFINLSARSTDQGYLPGREDWFIPLQNLIQVIVPDYFGNPATYNYWGIWNYAEFVSFIGIVATYFALIAVFFKKAKHFSFPLLLFIVSIILATKNPISEIPYTFHFPFISTIQPSRIIFLIDFSLCAISAFGLEVFLNENGKRKKILTILGITTSLILLAIFTYTSSNNFPSVPNLKTAQIALRNTMPAILIAVSLLFAVLVYSVINKKRIFIFLIFLIATFELFRFSNKFLPFTKESLVFPKTAATEFLKSQPKPYRIMTMDRRIFHPNFMSYYGIESIDGYDPLYLKNYGQFVSSWQANSFDSTSNSFNRIITPEKLDSPLVNLLNVKFISTFNEITSPNFIKVFEEGETKIYQNKNVLPRVFFVDRVVKFPENEEFITLIDPTFDLLSDATSQEFEFSSKGKDKATVEIQSYEGDYIQIKTTTDTAKPLVLTNIRYPGWEAFIDGKLTRIQPVDVIFQSVLVPPGNHEVVFKYADQKYQFSFVISIFGIFSVVLVSCYLWLKKFQS